MLKQLKRRIRFLLGIKNTTNFYSQAGEDAIILNTFSWLLDVKKGFYVDIGAYHPFKHSNTYLLYKWGWRGINIDPRPGSKKLFDKYRPQDTNIEAGIGASDSEMTFYMIDEHSTMNSFSRENLEKLNMMSRVTKTIPVPVYTFSSLMKRHPEVKQVDYVNIDAEGFELEILEGMDFNKLRPKIISIEQNNVFTLQDVSDSRVGQYLRDLGYLAYGKNLILDTVATVFYVDERVLPAHLRRQPGTLHASRTGTY